MNKYLVILIFTISFLSTNCKNNHGDSETTVEGPKRFELLTSDKTGVDFSNDINEDFKVNILNIEYLYNGGGVAIGDINNDGLPDIYFSSTIGSNKLYLNKGGLKFEDITDKAGVASTEGFKTGITMADVNGDGYLDIYVCRTNKDSTQLLGNILYINNGNLSFTDKSKEYGLADKANTNHAVFLDYDGDGDLDLFMMNHKVNYKDVTTMRLKQNEDGTVIRQTFPLTSFESCRLYKNDNNHFVNISKQAGISTSTFSLSATVADINLDNYPDIYLANDYIEPDEIYINNQKGGFVDKRKDYLKHMSQNSMGCDVADFNNDGLPDIINLDMAADDPFRFKQMQNTSQYERYNFLLNYGYGHQILRNMLQINNGNNTFSDIGQLSGVSNTDWSWAVSFNDFDNDGWKDIYITNGYPHDVTDNDYLVYTRDSIELTGGISSKRYSDFQKVLELIPSNKISNYIYHNKGDLRFENATEAWGMKIPSFSNGYASADLDGDGDLDIVVNNINSKAFVYENKTVQQGDMNFLQIKLNGPDKNRFGLGTKVWLYVNGQMQYQELYTNRGFLSSSEPLIHFGLGKTKKVDRVEVRWPDGRTQILTNVNANQRLKLNYSDAGTEKLTGLPVYNPMFTDISSASGLDYIYKDTLFVDFNFERLIPHKFSNQGPFITKADVNNDGREDVYIGGSSGKAGVLYLQSEDGRFALKKELDFEKDRFYEDNDAVFFDADGDKDLDLLVTSGSNESPIGSPAYSPRLYMNDGEGNFTRSTLALPDIKTSAGSVVAVDLDGDKDLDLIIGGKVTPGAYPTIPDSYILINDGGIFNDATARLAPELKKIGMVYSIAVGDLDGDKQDEIVLAGEWMPITVFKKRNGVFVNATKDFGLEGTNGWWNTVVLFDADKDGDLDIVGGNLGLNTRLKASKEKPLAVFSKDIDGDGTLDPIMAFTYKNQYMPYVQRDLLSKQVRSVKNKYPRYRAYSSATVKDIIGDLSTAQKYEAYCLSSSYFENQKGKFKRSDLPIYAQFSPVKCIIVDDFNKDGIPDLLIAGNDSGAETETGVYDASTGLILQGDGKGHFKTITSKESGIWLDKESRDMTLIKAANKTEIICTNNNGPVQVYVSR